MTFMCYCCRPPFSPSVRSYRWHVIWSAQLTGDNSISTFLEWLLRSKAHHSSHMISSEVWTGLNRKWSIAVQFSSVQFSTDQIRSNQISRRDVNTALESGARHMKNNVMLRRPPVTFTFIQGSAETSGAYGTPQSWFYNVVCFNLLRELDLHASRKFDHHFLHPVCQSTVQKLKLYCQMQSYWLNTSRMIIDVTRNI